MTMLERLAKDCELKAKIHEKVNHTVSVPLDLSTYKGRIVKRLDRQELKGIRKYGDILDKNPRPAIDALEYAAEEVTDLLMYLEELKTKLGPEHCEMGFNEYQRLAERTDNIGNEKIIFNLMNATMGMVGESAETLEHIKKVVYQEHELSKDKLMEEAGDTLWYIAKLARLCGVSLEELARRNIEKLRKRYPDGFSAEASINRESEGGK